MREKKSGRERKTVGQCCPHCADSKFPCVKMEKAMQPSPIKRVTKGRK